MDLNDNLKSSALAASLESDYNQLFLTLENNTDWQESKQKAKNFFNKNGKHGYNKRRERKNVQRIQRKNEEGRGMVEM